MVAAGPWQQAAEKRHTSPAQWQDPLLYPLSYGGSATNGARPLGNPAQSEGMGLLPTVLNAWVSGKAILGMRDLVSLVIDPDRGEEEGSMKRSFVLWLVSLCALAVAIGAVE